jgi:hypothetical protein
MAPHRHLVVDVTVTSARTNTNVPRIGSSLPLPDSLALGDEHGKLDADLRNYALLGTSSVQTVRGYYPFALGDGGRLAPMAAELVDRLAVLVAVIRRFLGVGAANSRSLRFDSYVHMQRFVRRADFVPFRCFWEDVRREFMQCLCAALHGTLGSYLREALQEGSDELMMSGHAFLFLGLRFSLFPSFCLVASAVFSC